MWAHFCSQNMKPFFSQRNQTCTKYLEMSKYIQTFLILSFLVQSGLNLSKIVQTRLVQNSQNVLLPPKSTPKTTGSANTYIFLHFWKKIQRLDQVIF